ncbi:MAG: hypothetical protein ACETWK_06705 [Candidatus Aminicenantaceae bacterium]
MNYNRKLIFCFFFFILTIVFKLSAGSIKTIWSVTSFGNNDFFFKPSDIEVDLHQFLVYIADSGNNRVLVFDFVTKDTSFGPDNNLYLLTYLESNIERRKKQMKKKELPPHHMRIEIISPENHKVLKYISCDPGTIAFSVMSDHRLVYIYEDGEGGITLKCIKW